MTQNFDIKMALRLCLSLLLFAVAVGPVCLMMSATPAMASTLVAADECSLPNTPQTPNLPIADCCEDHAPSDRVQAAKEAARENLVVAVVSEPHIPQAPRVASVQPVLAVDSRPVAHLTPLRL